MTIKHNGEFKMNKAQIIFEKIAFSPELIKTFKPVFEKINTKLVPEFKKFIEHEKTAKYLKKNSPVFKNIPLSAIQKALKDEELFNRVTEVNKMQRILNNAKKITPEVEEVIDDVHGLHKFVKGLNIKRSKGMEVTGEIFSDVHHVKNVEDLNKAPWIKIIYDKATKIAKGQKEKQVSKAEKIMKEISTTKATETAQKAEKAQKATETAQKAEETVESSKADQIMEKQKKTKMWPYVVGGVGVGGVGAGYYYYNKRK